MNNNKYQILLEQERSLDFENIDKYDELLSLIDKTENRYINSNFSSIDQSNEFISSIILFDSKKYYINILLGKIDIKIIKNNNIKNKIIKFLFVAETFLFLIDFKILKKLPTFSMFIDNDQDVIIRWAYRGIDIIFNFSNIKNQTFWIFTKKLDNEISCENGLLNSRNIFRKLIEAYSYMLYYV